MNKPDFSFRPINSADKARILEICAKIWDGNDYLPASFDSWLADREGQFNALLHEGQLIGCGRLSYVAPGHAWLEGLRKDIDSPVKGVGRALCLYALHMLKGRTDLKSVRFATYIMDEASIKLNEQVGFKRIATATVRSKIMDSAHSEYDAAKAAPLTAEQGAGYTTNLPADTTQSWERLRTAGWFKDFIFVSWRAYPVSGPADLQRYLEAGSCLECRDSAGRLCGSIVYWQDKAKKLLTIAGLEAESSAAAACLLYRAEQDCKQAGFTEIEAMLPDNPAVFRLFDECGYQPWEQDNDFLLYELPLTELARIHSEAAG
ncbi:MAG: GNAT family N-acetyltransferase [Spirochaetes bacterium]|nr:GNAT family N-acetyltransferase [Spirochaetota bacterium]